LAIATLIETKRQTERFAGYYQQWVDRFEKLKISDDPDLQQIGEEGLKWAIPNRDACRRSERKEQIFG
jgi:hypothetical protein